MAWESILSIVSLVTAVTALFGLGYKVGSINGKIEILWEAYKAEARQSTKRRGVMQQSSEYHLTKQGLDMIPPKLKGDIKCLLTNKHRVGFLGWRKLNPNKVEMWDVIKQLGGVERLAEDASQAGVGVQEMVVIVETYIRHLREE